MKRRLERALLQQSSELLWNTFIDILAMSEYEDLTPLQRTAHLAFWYDSEVQNGGHGQYLENSAGQRVREAAGALEDLGLPCQAKVVRSMVKALDRSGPGVEWTEVFGDDEIVALDDAFWECEPTIHAALEAHLEAHESEYVEFV